MYDCECLIHPFQNDPGTSQSQRVMDELLSGAAKIDARTLADLLDYFVQLSRHINYYDTELNVSDWQPFFKNSIPFILASIIKNQSADIENNFAYYNSLFEKKPSPNGLQLHAYFIYYRFINKINNWHLAVKDSGLPIESFLEILIKDKLMQPVKFFISYTNAAVKYYGIKRIDFSKLYDNKVWNLDVTDLYSIDNNFKTGTNSKFKQLNNLYQQFKTIASPFFDATNITSTEAESNLELSLLPLKEELQKKHPPHLGLLFVFLNIFRYLQNDLNGYTRKHLDFFYKDVLQIKSREAIPDKGHIIFEIQKLLKKYLVKKGILVKDGKDNNKQEILFSLDDEIVVNKTEVADIKTLFLNNQNAFAQSYVEGVYIANDATKADGIDKDFEDGQPKNFSTLGAKLSKYSDPETKIVKPYAHGRLGFILGSPVLYLKEGTRTIDINLKCELADSFCNDMEAAAIVSSRNCCDQAEDGVGNVIKNGANPGYPVFYSAAPFYDKINTILNTTYYYLNDDLLKDAVKKGISAALVDDLRNKYLIETESEEDKKCYCPTEIRRFETVIESPIFESDFSTQLSILQDVFKPFKPLSILFSGEKEWIEPSIINLLNLEPSPLPASKNFSFHINATLKPDKPAVTFYDKEKLKEDFNSIQPLVKIEIDDRVKFILTGAELKALSQMAIAVNPGNDENKCPCDQDPSCCLLIDDFMGDREISLYHFFRNIVLRNTTDVWIGVKVCGVRNLIVQNDENIDDVNKLMHPFGVRPKVGANFYIGNKEIFMKNWQEIWVNVEWKDRPVDFKDYYKHYSYEPFEDGSTEITNDSFKINIAMLENGNWKNDGTSLLFTNPKLARAPHCTDEIPAQWFEDIYDVKTGDFAPPYIPPAFNIEPLSPYNISSSYGFLRLTLDGVSFQHDRYAFVLMRHILALNNLVDPISIKFAQDFTKDAQKLIAAIILRVQSLQGPITNIQSNASGINNEITNFFSGLQTLMSSLASHLTSASGAANLAAAVAQVNAAIALVPQINSHISNILADDNVITANITSIDHLINDSPFGPLDFNNLTGVGLKRLADELKDIIDQIADKLKVNTDLKTGLPKEPYTPTLKSISLDYTANATLQDIDLIHLYPYAGTYKHEEIELQPTLFPTFCDEGTLFLGLKNLVPGNNLNILFQLAEATSDSESQKENVQWHYLDSNVWKPLRDGFEVLDDASGNLTTSGIIKFAMPANMTSDNTVMPKDLYWIKASIAQNSKAVSETTGIHPQAIRVTFTNDTANDKLRLSQPLAAGSISKLNVADANVKSLQQLYDTFDGSIPEIEQQFYVRVSEHLRHKGRAIQKFDYERLALEAFPQVFKAKCINHSFALDAHLYKNDFPYAPGYVILAVIPDLYKLKAGNSFEPKVPVSIIEKIEAYIRKRTSPFVRFRAMNPRYEKINFCLRVQLIKGKDENYYREKLKQDLKELLAPWAVGKYDKLTFGQCVYRSDIIRFLENTDYVDFITDFRMGKEGETPLDTLSKVCPETPRSILIAGDIEVCINQPDCEDWKICSENDNNQIQIDCCTTPLIPVVDYCIDKNNMTG